MSKQSRKAYWAKMKDKKAWFQGQTDKTVEGPVTSNNPDTLGYPKEMGYDKKPMETTVGGDSRNWEQKWFENAAAETKKEMGPSGAEFKLKQDLQRIPSDEKIANAKLTAKFHAVAKNPKASSWTIEANGKPVLTANLEQIWGKELSEDTAKATATKEYAKSVMAKIRQNGIAHVAYLLTGVDVSKSTKAQFGEDMEANEALDNESEITSNELGVAVDIAEEKKEEIESLETQIVEKIAPGPEAVQVFEGLQEAEEALEATASELKAIKTKLASKLSVAKRITVIKLAEAALADAVTTFENADEQMEEGQELIPEADMMSDVSEVSEVSEEGEVPAIVEEAIEEAKAFLEGGEVAEAEMPEAEMPEAEISVISSAKVNGFVAARKARRESLAAMKEEQKYNVIPDGGTKDGADEVKSAHPNGGTDVKDLTAGGKPKNNGERFETIEEAQKADLEVATKMPKGILSASSKNKTTTASDSSTAADADAKGYWVDYFSQMGPEGKAYGQALVSASVPSNLGKTAKSLIDKQVKSAVEVAKAKLIRASELVEQAVQKGMVGSDIKSKMEMVDEIMSGGDAFFNSYKSAVEKSLGRRVVAAEDLGIRTASVKALKVGQMEERESSESNDLASTLEKFNWS